MAGSFDHLQSRLPRDSLDCVAEFFHSSEGIARPMHKERGNTDCGEVLHSKLRGLCGRMQGIGQKQKPIGHARVFGRDHARLPAAVGLPGQVQRNAASLLPQHLCRLADSFAIALAGSAGCAAGTSLPEGQVPAEHAISGIAKRLGDGHHQGILAIAAGSVGQQHGGSKLGRVVQPAVHAGVFKSLHRSHVCYV